DLAQHLVVGDVLGPALVNDVHDDRDHVRRRRRGAGAQQLLLLGLADELLEQVHARLQRRVARELPGEQVLGHTRVGAGRRAPGGYDPVHQQLVVVSSVGSLDCEVWAYDFTAPAQWKHLLPYNTMYSVTPQQGGLAYDPLRQRFVSTNGVMLSTTTPRTWTVT